MISTESTFVPGAKHAPHYAVVVLDGDGVIRLASPGVLDLFGRHPGEIKGQPVEWLVPPRLRTEPVSQWHELAASTLPGAKPVAFETFGLRHNGFEFPIQVSVTAVGDTYHRLFAAVIRDLTDRTLLRSLSPRRVYRSLPSAHP